VVVGGLSLATYARFGNGEVGRSGSRAGERGRGKRALADSMMFDGVTLITVVGLAMLFLVSLLGKYLKDKELLTRGKEKALQATTAETSTNGKSSGASRLAWTRRLMSSGRRPTPPVIGLETSSVYPSRQHL
jgi:hypothetical protein